MQLGMIGLGRMGANLLSAALYQRFTSSGEGDFSNQVLSAMRHAFGGHVEKPAGGAA